MCGGNAATRRQRTKTGFIHFSPNHFYDRPITITHFCVVRPSIAARGSIDGVKTHTLHIYKVLYFGVYVRERSQHVHHSNMNGIRCSAVVPFEGRATYALVCFYFDVFPSCKWARLEPILVIKRPKLSTNFSFHRSYLSNDRNVCAFRDDFTRCCVDWRATFSCVDFGVAASRSIENTHTHRI